MQRSTQVNSYLRVVCLQNNKCCLTFLNTQEQKKTVKPPKGWELLNTFCKKNKSTFLHRKTETETWAVFQN